MYDYSPFICPVHGIISEREMEDAPEIGGPDYWGEMTEPYGCPINVRVPVPTTSDRYVEQGFVRGDGVSGQTMRVFRWDDPAWRMIECMNPLEQVFLRTIE